MKKANKIIAFMLVFIVLLTNIPIVSFAETDTTETSDTSEFDNMNFCKPYAIASPDVDDGELVSNFDSYISSSYSYNPGLDTGYHQFYSGNSYDTLKNFINGDFSHNTWMNKYKNILSSSDVYDFYYLCYQALTCDTGSSYRNDYLYVVFFCVPKGSNVALSTTLHSDPSTFKRYSGFAIDTLPVIVSDSSFSNYGVSFLQSHIGTVSSHSSSLNTNLSKSTLGNYNDKTLYGYDGFTFYSSDYSCYRTDYFKFRVCYTNIPSFTDKDGAINYVAYGTNDGLLKDETEAATKFGCDGFGFKSFNCTYDGVDTLTVSYVLTDDLPYPVSEYEIDYDITSILRYCPKIGGKQTIYSNDSSYYDSLSQSGTFKIVLNESNFPHVGKFHQTLRDFGNAFISLIDTLTALKGSGTDYSGYTYDSSYMSITFFLKWRHLERQDVSINGTNDRYGGDYYISESEISSDVRYFKYDYTSGELVDDNKNLYVTTTDVTDADGTVVGKHVTDIVTTDDSGNTLNHYEVTYNTTNTDNSTNDNSSNSSSTDNSTNDNSSNSSSTDNSTNDNSSSTTTDKSTSKVTTVTISGNDVSVGASTGSGSGSSGDTSTDSLLKKFSLSTLLTWILALFGVGDSNEGILSLIGKIFVWMPDEFVVILVGGIAVIITISIIKHIKGGDS